MSTEERDQGVVLFGVEEEHVRSADRFLSRFFAKLAEVTRKIDGLGRLGCGGIRGQLCAIIDVQESAAFLAGVRLVGQPDFIRCGRSDTASENEHKEG